MTSRKDQLKNLFQPAAPTPPPQRAASGAVKAMGLSLGNLQREIDEVLKADGRIAEIDTSLIDPSPYADRLSDGAEGDEDFEALTQSIRTGGQQVPVLLRPGLPGRYEAAYGHRRIKAAARLGIPVKAVIRPLTDAELLLAQGKENAERRNLSFIEKAMFARALIDAGIARAAVMEALSLHKADMSRFLQVAALIPPHIARAIGPAPKAGRPRWMALGALLQKDAARLKAEDEIAGAAFAAASSDRRFQMLYDRLARRERPKAALRQMSAAGIAMTVARTGRGVRFETADAAFAAWLEDNFARLAKEFAAKK